MSTKECNIVVVIDEDTDIDVIKNLLEAAILEKSKTAIEALHVLVKGVFV